MLLALLDSVGGVVENTDFQKLLFLFCQESESQSFYEFVPYKFGAFSFTSYADRRKLLERGLLEATESHWRISVMGKKFVGGEADWQMSDFAKKYQKLRGRSLVEETYRRFPFYATKSTILEKTLRYDSDAIDRVKEELKKFQSFSLATIGYEGRSLENFLNALLRGGITVLCDVRKNPISRKYGFSKRTLASACHGLGISYEHVPALGIASSKRRNLKTRSDYDRLFADYEKTVLPLQTASLQKISEWISIGKNVALTCYENSKDMCHRGKVALSLEKESDNTLVASHI